MALRAVKSLRLSFEREWDEAEVGSFWPTDVRRQVIMALARVGAGRRWVIEKLEKLEDTMLDGRDMSGRIDEYCKQAKAWVALGERGYARQTLRRMLQGSLGVGCLREDYQMDTWVGWLSRINEVEPERAAERIAWFARAIVTLEGTTEGGISRIAANELLAVTFRWSPRRAVSLFCWFLDQRIIHHEEAICVLLQEAVKGANPPTTLILFSLADFLLPTSTMGDPELAALLIERTATFYGNGNAVETARYLLSKVNIYTLPSARPRWREGIEQGLYELGIEPCSIGFEPIDHQSNQEKEGSSRFLKLKDSAETLSINEVKKRISSVSDLQKLLDNESDGSYFDWKPIIVHLFKDLDLKSVYTLANLFQCKHRSAFIFAILSERLYVLGDLQGAWSLGEQALDASKVYKWERLYDGCGRLAAFRALVRANPIKARPLIYETLIRDLTGEFRYPLSIALNLDDILPMLTDELPVRETWSEVEQYVRALFEDSSLPADGPADFDHPPLRDTPSEAVADLLMLHLDHPVSIVSQAAQRACAKLLFRRDPAIQGAMQEFLEKTESYQEHILMVLDAVSLQEPDAVAPFLNGIVSLHLSPNYAIRQAARTICRRIGREPDEFPHSSTLLPAIYQIALHPRNTATPANHRKDPAGELLLDLEDPLEMVRPFDTHIELIAKKARLPKINVCHRTAQIMRQLAPEASWSVKSEEQLRAILGSAKLCFSFRRPRAVLARRAMFHVIAELVEAGGLDLSNLWRLEPFLRFYDPVMILAEPVTRPPAICPIAGKKRYGGGNEEWLRQVDGTDDLVGFETPDGFVILAEETKLKRLEWEEPMEIRRSLVCLSATPRLSLHDKHDLFFHRINNFLVLEYPNLGINTTPTPLILRHTAYGYDSPGKCWLAFNPTIAYQLGWNLAVDGLFKWVNYEGQIMVESIWWVDGLTEQSPPHLDDEVGEGWIVIASQKAWDTITLQLGTLKRMIHVERCFHQDDQLFKRDMQLERLI